MAYLEVTVQNGTGGKLALSANGVSLSRPSGCLGIFSGGYYPNAYDYFNGLQSEGWVMVSSNSTHTVGMINGMPFAGGQDTYIFSGNGRYEIEWNGDRWKFKEYKSSATISMENENYQFMRRYDQMVQRHLTDVGKQCISPKVGVLEKHDFEIDYIPPEGTYILSEPQWWLRRKSNISSDSLVDCKRSSLTKLTKRR